MLVANPLQLAFGYFPIPVIIIFIDRNVKVPALSISSGAGVINGAIVAESILNCMDDFPFVVIVHNS